jgi:hypothetical protein
MPLWISDVIGPLMSVLAPLSLLVVGFLVEKKFISRMTLFTNAIAINIVAFGLSSPPSYLVWYANIGFVLGVIALLSYATSRSMPSILYAIGWLYSSIVVGILIFLFVLA